MIFRDGLLEGRRVAVDGQSHSPIVAALTSLGADVQFVGDEPHVVQALVHDARPTFAAGGEVALQRSLERTWTVTRDVATAALLGSGGRLLLIAPSARAGPYADAARAAFENLARTLSVEWARFGVTSTALWPGAETTDEQLAELICFLVSDAGGYFSGCRFELGVS